MNLKKLRAFSFFGLVVTSTFSSLQGATLTWDPVVDATPATGSDGSGAWDNTALNFSNGTSDVASLPFTQSVTPTVGAVSGSNTFTVSTGTAASLVVGQVTNWSAFPNGTTISAIDTGTGVITMSANATASNSTVSNFSSPDNLTFGVGTGTAGTITISGTQSANSMTINAAGSGSYTFTGGSLNLGNQTGGTGTLTVNSDATIANTNTVGVKGFVTINAGKTLTYNPIAATGGISIAANYSGAGTLVFGTNFGTSGGITTGAMTLNTGNVSVATINQGNAAITTTSGGLFIGQSGNSIWTMDNAGASLTVGSGSALIVARGGNAGTFILKNGSVTGAGGGYINNTDNNSVGVFDLRGGTYTSTNVDGITLYKGAGANSHSNMAATLLVSGTAVVTVPVISYGTSATTTGVQTNAIATVDISGGTVTADTVRFGTGSITYAGTSAQNFTITGGNLYVGTGGIVSGSATGYTRSITLSGGILGASGDWNSSLDMTLATGTAGVGAGVQNITFQAANAGGGTSHNIGLSGVLSGAGGLTKTGNGILTLSGADTYAGATAVNAGTLALTTGSINFSTSITVAANATLQLGAGTGNGAFLADNGSLYLFTGALAANKSILNLNFNGTTESIAGLYINGVAQSAGIYDATALTGLGITASGSGSLSVSAIPEPSTYAALFGSVAMLSALIVCRRRRA